MRFDYIWVHLLWCQCWSPGTHWQPIHSHQNRPEQQTQIELQTITFLARKSTWSLRTVQLEGASAQQDWGSFPKWNWGGPSTDQSEEFLNPQQWNSDCKIKIYTSISQSISIHPNPALHKTPPSLLWQKYLNQVPSSSCCLCIIIPVCIISNRVDSGN